LKNILGIKTNFSNIYSMLTTEANGLKASVGDSYALHWQDTNKKLVPAVFAYDKNVKVYNINHIL
jgi:hypothetical protein